MRIYLNLLPKERKQELKNKKTLNLIFRQELLFLFPLLILVAILFNINYLLSFQLNSPINGSEQKQYEELGNFEKKFKQINETTAGLLKIQTHHLHWLNVFDQLNNEVPSNVVLSNFSTKDYAIFLVGKAKNRDALLDFKGKLEANSCFSKVNVPLSNLVVKNDVDFQIDFEVNSECLVEK